MYKITDYCNQFDVLSFLEDHRKFKVKRKELQTKLDSIPLLPSHRNESGIRSGGKSEPTVNIALKRMEIEEEISEIDRLTDTYDKCLSRLTERERDVICLFYSTRRSTPQAREAYCRKYLTNETDLYSKDKREAVERFRQIATDILGQ